MTRGTTKHRDRDEGQRDTSRARPPKGGVSPLSLGTQRRDKGHSDRDKQGAQGQGQDRAGARLVPIPAMGDSSSEPGHGQSLASLVGPSLPRIGLSDRDASFKTKLDADPRFAAWVVAQ